MQHNLLTNIYTSGGEYQLLEEKQEDCELPGLSFGINNEEHSPLLIYTKNSYIRSSYWRITYDRLFEGWNFKCIRLTCGNIGRGRMHTLVNSNVLGLFIKNRMGNFSEFAPAFFLAAENKDLKDQRESLNNNGELIPEKLILQIDERFISMDFPNTRLRRMFNRVVRKPLIKLGVKEQVIKDLNSYYNPNFNKKYKSVSDFKKISDEIKSNLILEYQS